MVIRHFLIFSCFLYIRSSFVYSNGGIDFFDRWDIDFHPNWNYIDRDNCGYNIADRIIGGKNAYLGQYPWLAQVGYSSLKRKNDIQFSCGGALINRCWVITAAHCVTDLPKNIYISGIRLGEFDVSKRIDCYGRECAPPTQDFAPVRILMHKYYGKPKFQNDIALIKLNRPIKQTRWVSPICLPYGPLLTKSYVGRKGEVAGWGIRDVNTSETTKILQTVQLYVVPNERCKKSYKKKAIIDDYRQMCIGGIKGYDSCGGDSGGPMIMVDSVTTPKYYVFGIVSFGSKYCGAKTTPGVYTNIVMYMKWILDQITWC